MNQNDISWWQAVLIIVVLFGAVVGIGYSLSKVDLATSYTPAQPVQKEKPTTKTRCDFTGFMASSIIAEESENGYIFMGRVSTIICGENGLSFRLEQ